MNKVQKLDQATASEKFSRRLTPPDSRDPEVFADASIVVPRSPAATVAQLPIISDDRWAFFHGTQKITNGALKGAADGNKRLYFNCPKCESTLRTHLAGVSDDFTEWKPIEPNSDWRPMAISVFAVECPNCGLADHFKIPCDQHGKFWMGDPLPQAQSRRVSSTTLQIHALIPVVCEEDLDPISERSCRSLRVETDTDHLCFYCPRIHDFGRGGGFRLVAAVRDPESKPRKGNLISISEFLFELCCGPECGFVGYFLIPVTGQTLRSIAR